MGKLPIFSLPKITHKNTKHRKEFIIDCLIVEVAMSVMYVSLERREDISDDGIKPLHVNKHRKQLKKIRSVYDYLTKKQNLLRDMMVKKDLEATSHKVKTKASKAFIQNISMTEKDINLEYVAINILRSGLMRKDRKTPLHKRLQEFCDDTILFDDIGLVVESVGIEFTGLEHKLAKDFINDLRY